MATAPRPGVAKRQAATQAAQRVLRITVKGETFSLCPENVPFHEQIAVRKACGGLPLSSFWGGGTVIAEDSLQVLFWLARRAGGEPSLSLACVRTTPVGSSSPKCRRAERIHRRPRRPQ